MCSNRHKNVNRNPAVDAQAVGRIYRVGQLRPVEIIRLVCLDSIEESIRARQDIKCKLTSVLQKISQPDLDEEENISEPVTDVSDAVALELSVLRDLVHPVVPKKFEDNILLNSSTLEDRILSVLKDLSSLQNQNVNSVFQIN